ncbi:hypothetical protein CCR75_006143 [Bremia lactucae]|uniref:Reverse transcriptase/retrotransposon-derived protein RNase H-like domain-containing protein n=1 Tax=Bremia lactucae TaxID=4779 RepID=A0A976FFY6_BRELC|nr:hypothetical protein CCR75_006143 [Bremia lactucae]
MYSSIAGPWTERRAWKFIKLTFVRYSLCFRICLTHMRKHKLYANLKKCIFAASKIPLLGCIVGKHGVRLDSEKIKAITDWPVPVDVRGLRKFLGLAAYLPKYSRNNAGMTVHLSRLFKTDEKWLWNADCQRSFEGIKQSLMQSPILAIADQDRPFNLVFDASNFAIGCALMQYDSDGAERCVCCQSRQLQPAERNYLAHGKEPHMHRLNLGSITSKIDRSSNIWIMRHYTRP